MSDNKRIAKNTLFLYFRMFLTMSLGLYSSRLILEALGIIDYGIYGVVGGIVTMFSFFNSAMISATERYLAFDIGKKNYEGLKKTFNSVLIIHFFIAILILILAETIGLWFLNNQLVIPKERLYAANWVFQFSIFSFLLGVIQVPYVAMIVAKENISTYAYINVLETILKFFSVVLLFYVGQSFDKLIFYAGFIFIVALIVRSIYRYYCKRKFKETKFEFYSDKKYYKELLFYSGWNLFGNIAGVVRGQGVNILLNLFYGPVLNATFSLTLMIQGVMTNFISSFQMAVNPQIVKNYAAENKAESLKLIYLSSKFSFAILALLIVPLLFNLEYVLNLWLGKIPSYLTTFLKLSLIFSLIETISNPIMFGLQATGKIRNYQVVVGGLIMLNFPIIWILFKFKFSPEIIFYVYITISVIALFIRLYFMKNLMETKIKSFFKSVLFPILLLSGILLGFVYFIRKMLDNPVNFFDFLLQTGCVLIVCIFTIYIIILTKHEKNFITNLIKSKIINK